MTDTDRRLRYGIIVGNSLHLMHSMQPEIRTTIHAPVPTFDYSDWITRHPRRGVTLAYIFVRHTITFEIPDP